MRIGVVLPCFKSGHLAVEVISKIGPEVDTIIVVDDACPQHTGNLVQERVSDTRVHVIYNEKNLGVGGAVVAGYRYGQSLGLDILVKVDSDGQMDPALIPKFTGPIEQGKADYTKGNRFYNVSDVSSMPPVRLIGNAGLSFFNKFSSGYWNIFDPTNGYTAIHADLVGMLDLDKVESRFFFESDLLMRLNLVRAVVWDVPMKAHYGEEVSNLSIADSALTFGGKHIRNFFKRIFYTYFLRDFSIASIQLLLGAFLMVFSLFVGGEALFVSAQTGVPSTAGTTMLFGVSFLSGLQLLLAFLSYDYQMIPQRPVHTGGTLKQSES